MSRLKFVGIVAIFASLLLPARSNACSQVGCLGDGNEVHQRFVIEVKHGGKPLPGVTVEITTGGGTRVWFSGVTASNGKANAELPPGNYWLEAKLLGTYVDSECFHISSRATHKAKKHLTYRWNDDGPQYRRMAGRFVDFQPGQGGTPFVNRLRPVEVTIAHAKMKLQSPTTHAVYNAESDTDGHFTFGDVPAGTYVLHIDGGSSTPGRDYGPADLPITIGNHAEQDTMLIAHRDPVDGSCGGIGIETTVQPK